MSLSGVRIAAAALGYSTRVQLLQGSTLPCHTEGSLPAQECLQALLVEADHPHKQAPPRTGVLGEWGYFGLLTLSMKGDT